MSYTRPTFRHPEAHKNQLGYTRTAYEGSISTLCAGCGHDSIVNSIITAFFEMSIEPHRIVKLSGIGCSSKTPAYFLNRSHGFNSVHGRMPSVATGANMANRELIYLGVSGDGDTASIGMGQFTHVVRRNLDMVYIVMNNGCYGLTKGQDSATADKGSKSRKGAPVALESIDLCELALGLGAGFVARGFSGDKKQLVPMLKAAIAHKGLAFVDVVSPCVTFNNAPTSTKSYSWVREHMEITNTFDFIPLRQEITTDYPHGSSIPVTLHDGSMISLYKREDKEIITNRQEAINALEQARSASQVLTGILFLNPDSSDFHDINNTITTPLNRLGEKELCPGNDILQAFNDSLR
ncbi:2-oxoacid:ferredoxin oxidoreductase subunit beta [Desulfofustis glycolicus]|uniref:2-oxoglutarate ferredoxin oxidoreductase subunit beta n=1 Tax=Desulfofustis glycolicus DSM 9705 TaxID=1121409 RepID=A0A1M5WEC8_9BACT|nr:2-oxoacid:ferredoxin oxidoreductase subunit beta [Desulfofustis glycolicus]MCB2217065.1 2-oxoacid:ferredoxin oxidoreductase subunit beta [Desulfobulbaceae bacterium]SHH85574.1 2-oxoglutarate ferredoxin oxidoreductase subunit beta [Desulfofustis glycolicus DSM 9705]